LAPVKTEEKKGIMGMVSSAAIEIIIDF